MRVDQLLFLLEDFLYELLVVVAQIVHIVSILLLKLGLCLYSRVELVYLDDLHRILCCPSFNPSISSLTTKPLVMVCKHRLIFTCGSLADRFEAWLFEIIRVTTASEHLGRCLWSGRLRSPRGDQARGSLLRLITILVTKEALRWRLLRLLLTAILYSLNFVA